MLGHLTGQAGTGSGCLPPPPPPSPRFLLGSHRTCGILCRQQEGLASLLSALYFLHASSTYLHLPDLHPHTFLPTSLHAFTVCHHWRLHFSAFWFLCPSSLSLHHPHHPFPYTHPTP